jgi:hypothetical protein
MRPARNEKARVARRRLSGTTSTTQGVQRNSTAPRAISSTASVPKNWRDRMPDPAGYYAKAVANLSKPNALGWAQGACPFHEDKNASLSVHVTHERGGWRCFAGCGGGDLLGFHMKRTGQSFRDAVINLIRGNV